MSYDWLKEMFATPPVMQNRRLRDNFNNDVCGLLHVLTTMRASNAEIPPYLIYRGVKTFSNVYREAKDTLGMKRSDFNRIASGGVGFLGLSSKEKALQMSLLGYRVISSEEILLRFDIRRVDR